MDTECQLIHKDMLVQHEMYPPQLSPCVLVRDGRTIATSVAQTEGLYVRIWTRLDLEINQLITISGNDNVHELYTVKAKVRANSDLFHTDETIWNYRIEGVY